LRRAFIACTFVAMERAIRQPLGFRSDAATGFRYRLEVVTPVRPNLRETMMRWCLGKPYRIVPPVPHAGETALWCFMAADDADFFQATFGGKVIQR
jgi:hypothetical protein